MATLRDTILTALRLTGHAAYTAGMSAAAASASRLAAANTAVDAAAHRMGAQLNSQVFNIGNFMHWVTRATMALGALATAGAYIGLKFDASMEQSTVAFEHFLGETSKANAMLSDLFDLAAKTPFEFPQLTAAAQKLLGFGMAAKDVLPLLTKVGDAVAGIPNVAPDQIDRITRALGQMQAKGKVYSEELLQLADAGLPAYQMLAKGLDVSGAKLNSMLRKGQIDAKTGLRVLSNQMAIEYKGMAAKQAKTFNGLLSTIRDYSRMILGQAVKPLFDYLSKKVLPKIAEIETSIVKWGRSGGFDRFRRNMSEGFKEGTGQKQHGLFTPDKQLKPAQKAGRILGKVWKAISGYFKDLMNALKPAKPFWDNVLGPFLKGVVFGALAGVVGIFKILVPVIKIFAIALGWIGQKLEPLRKVFFWFGFIIGYIFGPGKIFGAAVKILGVFGRVVRIIFAPLKLLWGILKIYYTTQAKIIWWVLNKLAPAGSTLETIILRILAAWDKVKGAVKVIAQFINKYVGPIAAAFYQLGLEIGKKFMEGLKKHGKLFIALAGGPQGLAILGVKSVGDIFRGKGGPSGGGTASPSIGAGGSYVNPSTGMPNIVPGGSGRRASPYMVPGLGGFTIHNNVYLDGKLTAQSVAKHTADKKARR